MPRQSTGAGRRRLASYRARMGAANHRRISIMSPKKIAKLLVALSAGYLCAGGTSAQEQPAPERAFFEELPIVSVSRLPQTPTNTPGAVTVFDHDFIRATGYRDIYRILKLVPGMLAVNEYGHTPLVAYHGLSNDFPNRMQVL